MRGGKQGVRFVKKGFGANVGNHWVLTAAQSNELWWCEGKHGALGKSQHGFVEGGGGASATWSTLETPQEEEIQLRGLAGKGSSERVHFQLCCGAFGLQWGRVACWGFGWFEGPGGRGGRAKRKRTSVIIFHSKGSPKGSVLVPVLCNMVLCHVEKR